MSLDMSVKNKQTVFKYMDPGIHEHDSAAHTQGEVATGCSLTPA